MQIVAPHIHFLRLTHSDESKCSLVDVTSLTEASLNIHCSKRLGFLFDDFGDPETGLADSLQVMILETLVKLHNVEKLTLSLQILSLAVVCGVTFPTFKVEALTIETDIYPSIIPSIAKLLQNSPGLKKIKLNIVDCNILDECCLTNYLYCKGLETRECWKPKDLDLSEPKLMTSFMKFLLKKSEAGWYMAGSYTFSQNNNCELSFVIDSTPECIFRC
uniref:F-box/LRR-repeat protein n=1 Tax=Noccaea caerulescens TaxID=107243 RepID=A0A1J3JLG2_NOCCA